MEPARHVALKGPFIRDIPDFYAEINRILMAGESWRIGESLDALDDMMRGGYGAAQDGGVVVLHRRDIAGCPHPLWLTSAWKLTEHWFKLATWCQTPFLNRSATMPCSARIRCCS